MKSKKTLVVVGAVLVMVLATVGIAGAPRKYKAILGALRGRWINVLITDRTTAARLLEAD